MDETNIYIQVLIIARRLRLQQMEIHTLHREIRFAELQAAAIEADQRSLRYQRSGGSIKSIRKDG